MSPGGFAIAIAGAFISFLPLLQILLPLKAAEIAPSSPTATLSAIAASGALIAGASNLGIGWLSDRTSTRFGRRQPWILGGLLGVMASYAVLWWAHSAPALLAAFALFQISFNAMFSPLLALVADRVPSGERGKASSLIALGTPVGTFVGLVVIGSLFPSEGEGFLALAAIVLLTVGPFALRLGSDPPALERSPSGSAKPLPLDRRSRNFLLGCAARICVLSAFTVAQLYILFYVRTIPLGSRPHAVEGAIAFLGVLYGAACAAAGVALGQVSDAIGRRKPLVIAAAILVCAGMATLALALSWTVAVAGYVLFAVGAGGFTAVEFALMVDILPSPESAARDLGILNLSNIVPQIVAPLCVAWVVSLPGATIHWAFGLGAIAAIVGAALVGLMRSVP